MATTLLDLDALDALINTAGQIPTRIDTALGEATRVQALKDYKAAQRQITIGHEATGEIGATLEAIQQWSKEQRKALSPPASGGAPPTSFDTRADFDRWAVNWPQALTLDGVPVHTGFGPPWAWITHNGKLVPADSVAAPPTTTPPLPPPGPVPAGVILLADWDNAAAIGRNVACVAGQTYAIRFVIPRGPYRDAQPRVVGSVAIVPSGSGAAAAFVLDAPAPLAPAGGAGGQANQYLAMTADLEGKIKYLVFRTEQNTNMLARVLLPTPV